VIDTYNATVAPIGTVISLAAHRLPSSIVMMDE